MQILQWLFNLKQEEEEARETASSTNKNRVVAVKEVTKSKDLVTCKGGYDVVARSKRVFKGNAEQGEVYSLRIFLCGGSVRECFYSTLNLKKLRSFQKGSSSQQYCFHSGRVKKSEKALCMGHKADQSPAHAGNKVLPICDASVSTTSTNSDDQCESSEKKEKPKSGSDNKNKTISRMKELLRWAAAAKADKGGKYISRKVLHFRNRSAGGKTSAQDDNDSTSSPKISFRWETLSCSTTSSAYSALSLTTTPLRNDRKSTVKRANSNDLGEDVMASDQCNVETVNVRDDKDHSTTSRPGNWITTDSEFVVLEL